VSADTAARLAEHAPEIDRRALSVSWQPAPPMQREADMLLALIPGLVAVALFVATLTLKRPA